MKAKNLILIGLLIIKEYFTTEACHQANFEEVQPVYMNERLKRNVGRNTFDELQNNRNLENFFTDCMARRSLSYSWRSIVHFIIADTKWYQESDQLYCSHDDSSSCWNYNVDFLIDRTSFDISKSVKDCIVLYEQRTRSRVIVKSRTRRQINFNSYLLSLLANNGSALVPTSQSILTNGSNLNAQNLVNWYTYNQYLQTQQAQQQPNLYQAQPLVPYQGQQIPYQGQQPLRQGQSVVPYQPQSAAQQTNVYQAQPVVGNQQNPPSNYAAQQPSNQAWNTYNQPPASLSINGASSGGLQQPFAQQTPSPTSSSNQVTYKMEDYMKLKSDNNVYQLLGLPTVPLPRIDERDMKTYTNWQQNNEFLKQIGMPTLPSPTFTLKTQLPSSLAPAVPTAYPNPQIYSTDWKQNYLQYVQGNNGIPILPSPAYTYQPPSAGSFPPPTAFPSSQNNNWGFTPVTAIFCPQVTEFSQCIQRNMPGSRTVQARSSNYFDMNAVISFVSAHYSRCTNAFGIHKSRMDRMPCAKSGARSRARNRPSDCSTQILNDIVRPDGPMRPAIEMCNSATRSTSRAVRPTQYHFNCSKTWTKWYNTHNPTTTTGDYEGIWEVQMKHYSEVCTNPSVVEVQLADGRPYHTGGDTVTFNPNMGLTCVNAMQQKGICNDYKVRFCC